MNTTRGTNPRIRERLEMNTRLRALFCDHLSIMRGKYLPGSKIGDGYTRFCRSNFGVHYDKDLLNS